MFTNQKLQIANAIDIAEWVFNDPDFLKNIDDGKEESAVDAHLDDAVDVWGIDHGIQPSPGVVEAARILLLAMTYHAQDYAAKEEEKELRDGIASGDLDINGYAVPWKLSA